MKPSSFDLKIPRATEDTSGADDSHRGGGGLRKAIYDSLSPVKPKVSGS